MTERYYPFDGGAGATVQEDQWTKMGQMWAPTGVLTGKLNELVASGDSTIRGVHVASGRAWIDGQAYENDASLDVLVGATHASLPRIDRVVLRNDRTANVVSLVTLAGVANASPVAPALTQTDALYEMPVCQVSRLANNSPDVVAVGQVTDERYINTNGLWVPYTCLWTPGVIGNGSLNASYSRRGTTVSVRIQLVWGSTTTTGGSPSTQWTLTLPFAASSSPGDQTIPGFTGGPTNANPLYNSMGLVAAGSKILNMYALNTGAAYGSLNGTSPSGSAWGNTARFIWEGTYQAA